MKTMSKKLKLNLKLIKPLRRRRRKKTNGIKKSIGFSFGEQDQIDLISYSGLAEESTYLQIGDAFSRTLFISGYPYVANVGWLNMLINFSHDIDISYHLEQVDPLLALPKLNRKITELESTRRTMLKAGKSSALKSPIPWNQLSS
jgi:conjugal transfer ATP-binding protein TraC